MKGKNIRKIAASKVYILSDGKPIEEYSNHVVETESGRVTAHYPLVSELAMTEWLGGTIIIEGNIAAHYPMVMKVTEVMSDKR
ncbi:MAG: hypothetical protein UDK36_09310 [Bacteroidaceae bacterium]|nr:hypothetical protein [Bacteroidaceae bacterium]